MIKKRKKNSRVYGKQQQLWWKRYFKRMGRRKYRRRRFLAAVLILGTFLYLGAVGGLRDRLVQVKEDFVLEFLEEKDGIVEIGRQGKGGWRILLRLKTGEIEFCREEFIK